MLLLCEKKTVKRFGQCHVFAQSPPGWRPSDKYPANTSQHSWFVSECFTAVLFSSNGKPLRTLICAHSSQYRDAGRTKEIKQKGTVMNAACQGNLSACHTVVGLYIDYMSVWNYFLFQQRTDCMFVIKISGFLLFSEIIGVYCEKHSKYRVWQNAELVSVWEITTRISSINFVYCSFSYTCQRQGDW